jgi:hypothetical protein
MIDKNIYIFKSYTDDYTIKYDNEVIVKKSRLSAEAHIKINKLLQPYIIKNTTDLKKILKNGNYKFDKK